jgi:hypothetical protein
MVARRRRKTGQPLGHAQSTLPAPLCKLENQTENEEGLAFAAHGGTGKPQREVAHPRAVTRSTVRDRPQTTILSGG